VLHEGMVLTPRNLDQGVRRSVPGVSPRSRRAARSAELIGFRICIIGMTGRPENKRQSNNSIAPRKFLNQVWACAALSLVRNLAGRCDRFAKSPSCPNARTLTANAASSGRAASARIEGQEKNRMVDGRRISLGFGSDAVERTRGAGSRDRPQSPPRQS
jgi:hypothetical protein